jgi:hypothetical protein
MKRLVSLGLAVAALAFAAAGAASAQSERAIERSNNTFHVKACPEHGKDDIARCHAHLVTDDKGREMKANAAKPLANVSYNAAQLRSAYSIPWSGALTTPNGPLIAIVDAYGYSRAAADLATYRTQMGLPACTAANGCFTKVDQNGGTSYPADNTGWAQETALDIQMVSAICPNCRILLVQANTASFNDLAAAVDRAATMGAIAISNSYGASESGGVAAYEFHYNHPGVAITVSSGDNGYGVEFPASSPHVTAVGGTSLRLKADNSYASETAWSGAGSGCSSVFNKPAFQSIVATCKKRMVADVSAVADPSTGVLVYAPTSASASAWLVFGGTSVASPIIAAVYGVNGGPFSVGDPYNHGTLHDVTSGSNGRCRGVPSFYCNGVNGYDGPTGLGTPKGPSAF